MAADVYLADTTVYVLQGRYPQVRRRFEALLTEGRLAACQMTALEYLNNAANPSSSASVWGAVHGQRWIDVSTEAMNRALAVHRELASASQHRSFRLPDLIIAATAELSGATVLHYDSALRRRLRPHRQGHRPAHGMGSRTGITVDPSDAPGWRTSSSSLFAGRADLLLVQSCPAQRRGPPSPPAAVSGSPTR